MTPEAQTQLAGQLFQQSQEYKRKEIEARLNSKGLAIEADEYRDRKEVCQNLAVNPTVLQEIIRALDVLTQGLKPSS